MKMIGNETERFVVVTENGNHRVLDLQTNLYLQYGYNNPPLYADEQNCSVWGNYYSARGFCQTMMKKVS